MHTERWFNVLVLGGAAIGLTACGGDSPKGGSGGNGPSEAGGDGAGGTDDSNAGAGGTGGQTGGAGSGATGGDPSRGGQANAGGATNLICSDNGSPADPCGCPCCWANDCANSDESCCSSFCEAGNDGLGCCGL